MIQSYRADNPSIPVSWLCSAFNLCRASYYAGLKAYSKADQRDWEVWQSICRFWEQFPGVGYRKLASALSYGEYRIRRILKKYRADQPVTKKRVELHRKIPNVIKKITHSIQNNPEKQQRGNWVLRDGKNQYRKVIEPTRPYQLWAGDWKEVRISLLGVTVYAFVIIDCFTRQLMGWELSIIKDKQAAIAASQSAIHRANAYSCFNPRSLIMHTDQGSAYIADDYIRYWRNLGVILSTADKGKPTQNPYIEAFFSLLSRFWLHYHDLLTVYQAKQSLNHFFNLYNSRWPHGSIGNRSPNQKLQEFIMSQ